MTTKNLAAWKAMFYSTPASSVSMDDALRHTIKKWDGLTKENMNQFGVYIVGNTLCVLTDGSDSDMIIGSGTCALCHHHLYELMSQCVKCPIYVVTGRQCDKEYRHFICDQDATPMIDLLSRVAKRIDDKS